MDYNILTGLSAILGLGIAAQWIAWRFHLPAILLLMVFGIVAGPVSGYLRPDEMLGGALMPLVSISIGIILFEGGMDLKLEELKKVGGIVRNLVTVGLLVTWVLASGAAILVFGLDLKFAALLGGILTVTGPTVIIPLLRHIRLSGGSPVGTALKWEGIVIDPIGAVFAVLVLNAVLAGGLDEVAIQTFTSIIYTILVGGFFGIVAAAILIVLFRHHMVPDFLKNPVALALVVVSFVSSNVIQHESGLLTTTLMGVILANQKYVRIKELAEFKETLRVLLISALFIVLSARIDLESISSLGVKGAIFTAILILVVRPASVFVSTIGSDLSFKEKLFLSSMAPRGIVAAAVASIFAVELAEHGQSGAGIIADICFMVIIGTVLIYGIFTPIVARILGLSSPNPQGVLFIGAHNWARDIAIALQNAGSKVMMIDTNSFNIKRAREMGIESKDNNVVFDPAIEELVLDGLGKLVAMTSNDEVNTLSAFHFIEQFGGAGVYQLPPQAASGEATDEQNLPSRILFGNEWNYKAIDKLYEKGAKVETLDIESETDFESFISTLGKAAVIPFFHLKESGDLEVFSTLSQPKTIQSGKFICLTA